MADEIISLKGKRNVYRRHLTNVENELVNTLQVFDKINLDDEIIKLNGMRNNYKEEVELTNF